jgi:AmmeMemoRadiSam system protein A
MRRAGATTPGDQPLTEGDQQALLGVARGALAAHLAGRAFRPDVGGHPILGEKRGAFVTLHSAPTGDLRGCIGRLQPDESLADTVAEMAIAAATSDRRFSPVTLGELPSLRLEVSALGPMRPIRPEDVEVGRHGLLLSRSGRRGVLLPQVPVEHGWDRETFLDQTCLKAGLPPGSWRDGDAELLAFTAEVFGEGGEG